MPATLPAQLSSKVSVHGYLQRFPIDVLKIDKAFVDQVGPGGDHSSLTRAIVALGDALGLVMVAEGIERSEHVEGLRFLGSKLGQGYHFSRPLPVDQFSRLLSQSVGTPTPVGKARQVAVAGG